MWEKYRGKGVMIIGIHTPEFEFEKSMKNVREAVKRHRINYPVLSDPDRINWENFGNTYWPRAALVDANGSVIMEHVGESGYEDIDAAISSELERMEWRVFQMPLLPRSRPFP
jgi:peroxiredoxin